MVNFRMNQDLKRDMELVCKDLGMSLTTAFTIFATKVSREKRIPFELALDPFYSDINIARLRMAIEDGRIGKNMNVHELIEVDDND